MKEGFLGRIRRVRHASKEQIKLQVWSMISPDELMIVL